MLALCKSAPERFALKAGHMSQWYASVDLDVVTRAMSLKRTGCLILAYGCLGLIVYSMFQVNVVPIDGMWKTLLCAILGFLATGHIFSMLSGELTRNHSNIQHALMQNLDLV